MVDSPDGSPEMPPEVCQYSPGTCDLADDSSRPFEQDEEETIQVDLGRKLLNASNAGNIELIKELISAGAPFTQDWLGTSPLHWTAYFNHVECTEILLKSGISHDARNKVDRTPLHVAAQKGHIEVVKLLLAFGSDPNTRDMLRMSPLHWAAESGNKDVVRILLDHGAFPSTTSKFGKTPTDIAEDHGHYEIIKMIKEMKSMPYDERTARIASTRKESAALGKMLMLIDAVEPGLNKRDILHIIPKKKKIGIVVPKPYHENGSIIKMEIESDDESDTSDHSKEFSARRTIQLLKDHGITMLKPDNGTVVSSAVENGQTVKLTDAGKLALNSSKPPSLVKLSKPAESSQTIKLPNGKKIIQINADTLINLNKEKKLIIQPKCTTPKPLLFEGELFTDNEKYVTKIKTRISEAEKEAEEMRTKLQEKENEISRLKRTYEVAIKQNCDKK